MPSTLSAPGDLARGLERGDDGALAAVHDLHRDGVIASAERVLHDRGVAEEVAQEVFVDLWRRPGRFEPGRGSLKTFLYTQARSRAIDRIRAEDARRRREERFEMNRGRLSSTEGADHTDRWFIRQAVDSLPDDQREAIELAYFGGYSYREVACRLGDPEGTIKSRIRLGLAALRLELRSATDLAAAS